MNAPNLETICVISYFKLSFIFATNIFSQIKYVLLLKFLHKLFT